MQRRRESPCVVAAGSLGRGCTHTACGVRGAGGADESDAVDAADAADAADGSRAACSARTRRSRPIVRHRPRSSRPLPHTPR